MSTTILVLKKELKNLMVRSSMIKWYFMLIFINVFFLFIPQYESIAITKNRPLFAMVIMMFTSFLVPNNLSIDVIGGEKYHKTLETLFSTPLNIRSIFIGKTLFIIILGVLSLILTSIQDNIVLLLLYKKSFLDSGVHGAQIIGMYTLAVLSIILVAFIGSGTSLISNNLKINGYLISVVNIVMVVLIYNIILSQDMNRMILLIILLLIACLLIFILVTKYLTKQHVMIYLK